MNLLVKHVIIFLITLILSFILVYDLVDFFSVQKDAYYQMWLSTSNNIYYKAYISSINKIYLSVLFSALVITPIVGQIALYFELEKRRIENFFTSYSKLNLVGIIVYILLFFFWLIKPDLIWLPLFTYAVLPLYIVLLVYKYNRDAK